MRKWSLSKQAVADITDFFPQPGGPDNKIVQTDVIFLKNCIMFMELAVNKQTVNSQMDSTCAGQSNKDQYDIRLSGIKFVSVKW